jgi:hypothetical protein
MKPQPNTTDIQSLIDFVKDLNDDKLNLLIEELENRPKRYEVYLNRTEAQWEKHYGLSGDDIYNFLHPQQQGIGILG